MATPIQNYTNKGTFNPTQGQDLYWEYYFEITFTTNTEYQFFNQNTGAAGGLVVTNFPSNGQMPSNQKMDVEAMKFYWTPSAQKTQAQYQILITTLSNMFFGFGIQDLSPQYQGKMNRIFGNSMPLLITGAAAGDQLASRSYYDATLDLQDIDITLQGEVSFFPTVTFLNGTPDDSIQGDKLLLVMCGPKYSA